MNRVKHAGIGWSCRTALGLATAAVLVAPIRGAEAPEPAASVLNPSAPDDAATLGPRFESRSAGVSFCPPASCKLVDRLSSRYVAEWMEPSRKWTLTLGRIAKDEPIPLTTERGNSGKEVKGLLERTVDQLRSTLPGSKILRQDLTNIAEGGAFDPHNPKVKRPNVGLIAVRYTNGTQRFLAQQALIQANEQLYYLISLTSPGSTAKDDNAPEDPVERAAVEVFSAMLDSVRLLDRGVVAKDQDERLFRTRGLLVNLTAERLRKAMIREQWLRIIKDGKDVGYSYITEETGAGIPRPLNADEMRAGKTEHDMIKPGDGVLIGVRSRMIAEGVRSDKKRGPIQTDSAAWLFTTPDRRHEDWSRILVTNDHVAPKKGYAQEFGSSLKRTAPHVVRAPEGEGAAPGMNPNPTSIAVSEDFQLDVTTQTASENLEPLTRKLPPWYVPQAVGHMLPRLLPLHEPKNYLFATYVPDVREVMMRYIDVLAEQDVTFSDQKLRAVPIRDRLGLEGVATIHYMSPEGIYLGSETPDQKIVVLPTDAATLARLWQNADLTKPSGVERPAPGPAVAGPQAPGAASLVTQAPSENPAPKRGADQRPNR